MEKIEIRIDEEKIVFGNLGFLSIAEFVRLIHNNCEFVLSESRAVRERFDALKNFDVITRLDTMAGLGWSTRDIAEKLRCSTELLEEFLSLHAGFLDGVRNDPSYGPACARLRADKSLI